MTYEEKQLKEEQELLQWYAECGEREERRMKDMQNRTITMESRDNVWAWRKIIQDNEIDGKITVEDWGRDCDQYETTRLREIDATLDALATLVEATSENAEGPWSLMVMTPKEVEKWERTERDHAAEQMNY